MSKISDELRRYCAGLHKGAPNYMTLMALADRIDADMVELPKDVDGVPIHVGDTVWGCISGMEMTVHELRLTDRWTISTDTGFIPKASAVSHERPDGLERIVSDIADFGIDADIDNATRAFLVKIQKRICNLAKKESGHVS